MKNFQKLLHTAKESEGFSLLEIAVILAVISILSSFAIPNVLKIGKDADLSEAQSLLNSAAADCLQSLRNSKDLTQTAPDPNIISDPKISSINYKIKETRNTCINFQIEPFKNGNSLAGKDANYYTLGFKFKNDKLVKIAIDEAVNNRESCTRWAGENCGFDPAKEDEWIKYYEHLSAVAKRKESCLKDAQEKLKGPPAHTGMYETWVNSADSGCKKDAPNIPTDGTCEIESCNQIGFAKDGQPLSGEKALQAALCTEWLDEVRVNKFTTPYPPFNPTKDPMGNCPEDPDFWFIEGIDQKEKDEFKKVLCDAWIKDKEEVVYTNKDENKAESTEACDDQEFWFVDGINYGNQSAFNTRLMEKESEKCESDRESARLSGFTGKWGPKEGPGVCSEVKYICDKKIMDEYNYYQTCGAKPPNKCKTTLPKRDQDCVDYELNDYWYKTCGKRPLTNNSQTTCRNVGMGKPAIGGWNKTKECAYWAKCMGLY